MARLQRVLRGTFKTQPLPASPSPAVPKLDQSRMLFVEGWGYQLVVLNRKYARQYIPIWAGLCSTQYRNLIEQNVFISW